MMGLKSWMLWMGWMINAMFVCTLSVTIITILLKVPFGKVGVLHHSDGFLIWLFLLFYCMAGITFCFAIISLFSRRKFNHLVDAHLMKQNTFFFYQTFKKLFWVAIYICTAQKSHFLQRHEQKILSVIKSYYFDFSLNYFM